MSGNVSDATKRLNYESFRAKSGESYMNNPPILNTEKLIKKMYGLKYFDAGKDATVDQYLFVVERFVSLITKCINIKRPIKSI
jgi:hypothetical protein